MLYLLRSRKLDNVQAIISSAVVLHNILIDFRDRYELQLPPSLSIDSYQEMIARLDMEENEPEPIVATDERENCVRDLIIRQFF